MSTLIPLSGTDIETFVPSAFDAEKDDPCPKFYIRVPTFQMRDKMAALLFQRGFIPATQGQSRGVLINGLYELYMEEDPEGGEAKADEDAAFLEGYWTRSEVHDEIVQGWQMQEASRLFDVAMGVPDAKTERLPLPPAPFTMREQARQAAIVTHMLEHHAPYRNYQARFMAQEAEETELLTRLFIEGWDGLEEVKPTRDKLERLTMDCMEGARKKLAEMGAPDAWGEVVAQIRAHFGGSESLRKNSASPLDTKSSQNGSRTSSGDTGTSDGSSTKSFISAIPETELPETSAASHSLPSANSGNRKARRAGKSRPGQTAAPL